MSRLFTVYFLHYVKSQSNTMFKDEGNSIMRKLFFLNKIGMRDLRLFQVSSRKKSDPGKLSES
jgi:hypothetical protein